jgi:hypothetical protein
MTIKVSIGEAVDKLSILQIKWKKITDKKKLANIHNEYNYLLQEVEQKYPQILKSVHYEELLATNEKLWDVEDKLRELENALNFNYEFIFNARQVYKLNDYRADLKKRINQGYHSEFIEEKSYNPY